MRTVSKFANLPPPHIVLLLRGTSTPANLPHNQIQTPNHFCPPPVIHFSSIAHHLLLQLCLSLQSTTLIETHNVLSLNTARFIENKTSRSNPKFKIRALSKKSGAPSLVKDNNANLGSAVTIMFAVANRVLYKLALVPMKDYPLCLLFIFSLCFFRATIFPVPSITAFSSYVSGFPCLL